MSNPATATVAPPAPPVDIASLLKRTERESTIKLTPSGARTQAGDYGSAYITTGTRTVGKQSEDVLVIVDGSSRVAFPQSAVLVALMRDVLPRDIVRAVWAAADKARS